jgi:hypothetical protein
MADIVKKTCLIEGDRIFPQFDLLPFIVVIVVIEGPVAATNPTECRLATSE